VRITLKNFRYQNANAYLLFYRRRTSRPLGGKSHDKIEEARSKQPGPNANLDDIAIDTQLPTPPNESSQSSYLNSGTSRLAALVPVPARDVWPTSHSNAKSSPASTPPALEDSELPDFENSQLDEVIQTSLDPLQIASHHYDFPDPSSKASPTSSIEAEPDFDHDHNESNWDLPGAIFDELQTFDNDWEQGQYSDSGSDSPHIGFPRISNANPFADPTTQEEGRGDYSEEVVEEIPIHESKPLDIDT